MSSIDGCDDRIRCDRCGRSVASADGTAPLGWSSEPGDDGLRHLCDRCTREHARDIEAKLDARWWS